MPRVSWRSASAPACYGAGVFPQDGAPAGRLAVRRTDETHADLRDAAHSAVPVVRSVRDGQFGAPTPGAEYDVRARLNPLFHVVVSFQALAVKGRADLSSTPDRLGVERRARFAAESDALVRAWSSDSALQGESP